MKVLLINGSPHEEGSTYTALRFIADEIEAGGIEAEIYHLANEPVRSCIACRKCKETKSNRCVFNDDDVNIIIDKMLTTDGLILGAPVYYGKPNGHLLSIMDRVFYAATGNEYFKNKPGAAICVARRGGTTASLDTMNKYFPINGMPMLPSCYWTMVHGRHPADVLKDYEGIQVMQLLGRNMVWMLKSIEAGKAAGIKVPELPGGERIITNFIPD